MSIFGMIIAYACSWFLVLFMVLPWRVKIPEQPDKGHAASAPVAPMLGRKCAITTVLAVIPVIVLYLVISDAKAEEPNIYSTKGNKASSRTDCATYQPSDDINAKDTVTQPNAGNILAPVEEVHMGLDVPAGDYVPQGTRDRLGYSDIYLGDVSVNTGTGETRFNGQPIQPSYTGDCK
jgi:predicted secreted protein